MANVNERVDSLKLRPNFFHLTVGSVLMVFLLVLQVQLISQLKIPTIVAIVFFNIFFVFLLFPLDGPLLYKIILLIMGNFVGILWYLVQLSFESVFLFLRITEFRIVILLVKPLIDFMWMVVFWSFSLSVLASYKRKTRRVIIR